MRYFKCVEPVHLPWHFEGISIIILVLDDLSSCCSQSTALSCRVFATSTTSVINTFLIFVDNKAVSHYFARSVILENRSGTISLLVKDTNLLLF